MSFRNTFPIGLNRHSGSAEETFKIGCELSDMLKIGDCVAFHGNLGAGKTTLIKGIIAHFCNIDPTQVTSPTYTYVHHYNGVNHFDLYRLDSPELFLKRGLDEYLSTNVLTLIEWPERIEDYLPQNTLHLTIHCRGPEVREIVTHE